MGAKLTRSQAAQLAALTRWQGMGERERSLATQPARDAWAEKHGRAKLVRMAHQRHGRLLGNEKAPAGKARAVRSTKEDSIG